MKSGSNGELLTRCRDKRKFLNAIAPVIEMESEFDYVKYAWKKDSTLYEPKETDAGCYYEVVMNADSCYGLKWYCGC